MRAACIRHSQIPGSSKLFCDLLYRFDRVRDFYAHPPQLDAAEAAARTIDFDPARRQKLVEVLRSQNSAGGPAAERSLELLSQPGTVAVATGQQVGLFGGPVFAIYKALTAARFAASLTGRGVPAVPVFWLATEDHDVDEVDHAWIFDSANKPRRIQAGVDAKPGEPAGFARISNAVVDGMEDALRQFPAGAETVALLRECYRPGVSFGEAFQTFMRRLLAPYGLLHLDPMDPAIRGLAAPLVGRAIEEMPRLIDALLARGKSLEARGYHEQVKVSGNGSLLFLFEQDRRIPLKRQNDRYASEAGSFTASDLLRILDSSPERFSPNALLRPIVQDYILPTAVYVGGPAELAYLAQSGAAYEILLGRMPAAVPRATFTLLDERSTKLLDRYDLSVTDCFTPRAAFELRLAAKLTPPSLRETFSRQRGKVEAALGEIESALTPFDPSLGEAFERSRRKIRYQLSKIENKAARESLRRDGRSRSDAAFLLDLIYPERGLQERRYCLPPFLARHGLDLPDRLYAAVEPDCPDHQVLSL